MQKAQKTWGFKKTFLQNAIESIRSGFISHGFVDITKKQADELVENGIIRDVAELKNTHQLRDKYIAQAATEILSKNKGQNGLLLIADRHFAGVKDCLEKKGILLQADTIDRYEWYRPSNDNLMHSNGDHTFSD